MHGDVFSGDGIVDNQIINALLRASKIAVDGDNLVKDSWVDNDVCGSAELHFRCLSATYKPR